MSAETNPKVIYLAPACHEEHMQREWCEDDVWPACEECGSKNSSVRYNLGADFDRVTAERDALQQRLTAADERAAALETVSVKQAALLDELGIPLDEVDDLFGETLKNAKRYEYLRSVMAVENFPAPHPAWSEPSEAESKRIDDLCDAAIKP